MAFDPKVPYNDLPPLPPRAEIETKAILRKVASAGRSLAELKGLGATTPQPVDSGQFSRTKGSESKLRN